MHASTRRFVLGYELADFCARFRLDDREDASTRDVSRRVELYLRDLSVPQDEEGKIYLTTAGYRLIEARPSSRDGANVFVQSSVGENGASANVDILLNQSNMAGQPTGSNNAGNDYTQKSLRRQKSITTLKKATKERQKQSLDRDIADQNNAAILSAEINIPQLIPLSTLKSESIKREEPSLRISSLKSSSNESQSDNGLALIADSKERSSSQNAISSHRENDQAIVEHLRKQESYTQSRDLFARKDGVHSSPSSPRSLKTPQLENVGQNKVPEVMIHVEALSRAYRQSQTTDDIQHLLNSDRTYRASTFMTASRNGTLVRDNSTANGQLRTNRVSSASLTQLSTEDQIINYMDEYCKAVLRWMCDLANVGYIYFPSLSAALRSGDTLCRVAQRMHPKTPPSNFINGGDEFTIHKVIYFLDCCRSMNVPEASTFSIIDLMLDDNDPRIIIKTVLSFERVCRKKGWSGPRSPPPPDGYFDGEYNPPEQLLSPPPRQLQTSARQLPHCASSSQLPNESHSMHERTNSLETTNFTNKQIDPNDPDIYDPETSKIQQYTSTGELNNCNSSNGPVSGSSNSLRSRELLDRLREMEQLLQSERMYLQDLLGVVAWIGYSKATAMLALTPQIRECLFNNIEKIYILHKALYQSLMSIQMPGDLGGAAGALLSYMDTLKIEYTTYNKGMGPLLALLETRRNNTALDKHLTDFVTWPKSGGISLESYLLRTSDRLLEYAKRFDDIIKLSQPGTQEHMLLAKAIAQLQEIIQSLDTQRMSSDDLSTKQPSRKDRTPSYMIPSIVDRKDVDLGAGSSTLRRNLNKTVDIATLESAKRCFLCQGSVWEVLNMKEVQVRSLLLFHDVIVVAKEMPSNAESRFEVRSIIDLCKMNIKRDRSAPRRPLKLRSGVETAVRKFNVDPQTAIRYLAETKVLEVNVSNIASFLHKTPGLSRRKVTKFLSSSGNEHILSVYIEWYGLVFRGMRINEALRLLLISIRLSGDPESIERILTSFSTIYYRCSDQQLCSEQTVTILVMSMIQLNSACHGQASEERPSLDSYINRLISELPIESRQSIPRDLLESIYADISRNKFSMGSDSVSPKTINVSAVASTITLNDFTDWIAITVPSVDPQLSVRLYSHDIVCEPTILSFARQPTQHFRMMGKSVGRKRLVVCPVGPTTDQYQNILPQTVIVEPSYMKHTFSLECTTTEPNSGKGSPAPLPPPLVFTFSVATEEQKERWISYILSAVDDLKRQSVTKTDAAKISFPVNP